MPAASERRFDWNAGIAPFTRQRVNRRTLRESQRPAVGRAELGGRVDPEEMVDRRGEVLGGDRIASGVGGDAVGGADHQPARNPRAGEHHRVARGPVVAAARPC